jgi:hypothetical protein
VGRRIALYFAWDRAAEAAAPLTILDDRFPALFEVRRLFWPAYEALGSWEVSGQGIDGFIEHIFLQNFRLFTQLAKSWTQRPVRVLHRRSNGAPGLLDRELLRECETLIIISFDTRHSAQDVTVAEVSAVQEFLAQPDHAVFVCPHHAIGEVEDLPQPQRLAVQKAEFEHHGDKAIPGQQRFGGFALSLMRALGIPIRNRFGFRPATGSDGQPTPFELVTADHAGLLTGVSTLNSHPHLPHFERLEQSADLLEVLVRQRVDARAPRHPLAPDRRDFDSILQARAGLFGGALFVTDATLWSSAAGGLGELETLWRNVALGQPPTESGSRRHGFLRVSA